MPFTIDDLNYDKDSKERMPWEHYLELYAKADPKEIASRLSIPYDENTKSFTVTFLGSEYTITYPDFQVKHMEDEKKCLEAGMNAHLTKPMDVEKICIMINQLLNSDKF